MDPAAGPNEDLIEMPATGVLASALADAPSGSPAKLDCSTANGFAGDVDATFGEEDPDVAETQRKAEEEPGGAPDDYRWEAMAGIGRATHAAYYRAVVPAAIRSTR